MDRKVRLIKLVDIVDEPDAEFVSFYPKFCEMASDGIYISAVNTIPQELRAAGKQTKWTTFPSPMPFVNHDGALPIPTV